MLTLTSVPRATYRLQFNKDFTFKDALEIVDYLSDLGVSHLYASPLFTAHQGSTHGYDTIDYGQLNPEIGTEAQFEQFVDALHKKNMGIILDVVPNHMYIMDMHNLWWKDVLENGQSSTFANYFDIDWHSEKRSLCNKVLLPVLAEQYGKALENNKIKILYAEGAFSVHVNGLQLPTDPKSWQNILSLVTTAKDDIDELELLSIQAALRNLPEITCANPDKIVERQREKENIKGRLLKLFSDEKLKNLLLQALAQINESKFNLLSAFLDAQPYRLAFWRVANEEINYRRFFEIVELAGLKTERQEVFEATHKLIFQWIQEKKIDGLRIDHIDGLKDPEKYLEIIQARIAKLQGNGVWFDKDNIDKDQLFYVITEKILTDREKLHPEWLMHGTVGYDFLNQLNSIFIDAENRKEFIDRYSDFAHTSKNVPEIVRESKKLILLDSLSSELFMLTKRLNAIAEGHHHSYDFTFESLRAVLREVIACFPVYRSYIRIHPKRIYEEDRHWILLAIKYAERLNPIANTAIFDFLRAVLLLEHPADLAEEQIKKREEFVLRFQQLTGAIMAKGLEDTAFYRFYPIASIMEVGCYPYGFGQTNNEFHRLNSERQHFWPHSMLATTTHDTKRSEDVRARLNALSEMPEYWFETVDRWSEQNRPFKTINGEQVIPSANEEYLIYQSIIGTLPTRLMQKVEHDEYVIRIQKYMAKALNEAKVHSSWINPNNDYIESVKMFIEAILSSQNFLDEITAFVLKLATLGKWNSLSQTVLKFASPGVPDIYQGNEIFDFSLVDPDNRRKVDFHYRRAIFDKISKKTPSGITHDDELKMWVTYRMLQFRRQYPFLLSQGTYIPLEIHGPSQNHVIAFMRTYENSVCICVCARFFSALIDDQGKVKNDVWKDSKIVLSEKFERKSLENIFTNELLQIQNQQIHLDTLLSQFPWAVCKCH